MDKKSSVKNSSSHPIRVIHGPNLNMLGTRNPAVYGATTLSDVNAQILGRAEALALSVTCSQSNHEGVIIDWIHEAVQTSSGLIINPGGLTHTSVALGDAMEVYPHLAMEVHISNVHVRESFRHHSYVSPHVQGVICGAGVYGYIMALDALHHKL